MITNKDVRVEGSNLIINGEKHPLDPAVIALTKRANIVQGKLSALDTKLDGIEALEKTASGNPISLTGAAAAYAISNIMTIEPIQSGSGDPSPTNVRPISGISEAVVTRTGKNLFTGIFINAGVTNSYNSENGNLTIVSTGAVQPQCTLKLENLQKFAGQTVTFSISGYNLSDSSLKPYIALYKNSSNTLLGNLGNAYEGITRNSITVQLPDDIEHILFLFRMNQANVTVAEGATLTLSGVQLEFGTIATEYDPYNDATATITLGQTVYGGSVNFKTGIVTLTRGAVDMGLLTWTYHSATSSYSDFFDTVLPNDSILGDSEIAANIISPIYKTIPSKWIAYPDYDNNVQALAKDSRRFITCDNRFNNAADYTNAMTGNILVYELATPTTLTLTPAELELLKGANTISGNGANISISYIGR